MLLVCVGLRMAPLGGCLVKARQCGKWHLQLHRQILQFTVKWLGCWYRLAVDITFNVSLIATEIRPQCWMERKMPIWTHVLPSISLLTFHHTDLFTDNDMTPGYSSIFFPILLLAKSRGVLRTCDTTAPLFLLTRFITRWPNTSFLSWKCIRQCLLWSVGHCIQALMC